MRLKYKDLENTKTWEEKGFHLPKFDIKKMQELTIKEPEWVHFGGGNIFRAFPAAVCQDLLNRGILRTGIIVAEGYDYEIIEKGYREFDNLSLLVTLKADGNLEKHVIGSIAQSLCMDEKNDNDWSRLEEIFACSSLKMASFTITEKGYSLVNQKQEFLDNVKEDFLNGPSKATSYMGKLTALMYKRFTSGKLPLTMVSMDNCSHNGTKLKDAVTSFAKHWVENNLVDNEFLSYVESSVTFPWSMIDKITPRPADSVTIALKEDGFEDIEAVITSKKTYIAPFVNAEAPQYLVIEDTFVNGKLPLDQGGIIYTDRETVDKVEKMKVCTCLNPLHTALAIFGCLLSYDKISEEMKDKELVKLIEKIGYAEGLPVVVNPGIINPKDFINEVLTVRLPNPYMPDTPQRIACDTSLKLSIRFGETIKAYESNQNLNVEELTFIPLVFAGWLRYLMGVDDNGKEFELSPDPILSTLAPKFSAIKLGEKTDISGILKDVLCDKTIFGVDLYEVNLAKKVEDYFEEMIQGEHAIRNTLKKYLD